MQSRLTVTKLRRSDTNAISRLPVISPVRRLTMRMLETVTSSLLAIAAQALVVGVVVTIL
jgi:hypothetical protein